MGTSNRFIRIKHTISVPSLVELAFLYEETPIIYPSHESWRNILRVHCFEHCSHQLLVQNIIHKIDAKISLSKSNLEAHPKVLRGKSWVLYWLYASYRERRERGNSFITIFQYNGFSLGDITHILKSLVSNSWSRMGPKIQWMDRNRMLFRGCK